VYTISRQTRQIFAVFVPYFWLPHCGFNAAENPKADQKAGLLKANF